MGCGASSNNPHSSSSVLPSRESLHTITVWAPLHSARANQSLVHHRGSTSSIHAVPPLTAGGPHNVSSVDVSVLDVSSKRLTERRTTADSQKIEREHGERVNAAANSVSSNSSNSAPPSPPRITPPTSSAPTPTADQLQHDADRIALQTALHQHAMSAGGGVLSGYYDDDDDDFADDVNPFTTTGGGGAADRRKGQKEYDDVSDEELQERYRRESENDHDYSGNNVGQFTQPQYDDFDDNDDNIEQNQQHQQNQQYQQQYHSQQQNQHHNNQQQQYHNPRSSYDSHDDYNSSDADLHNPQSMEYIVEEAVDRPLLGGGDGDEPSTAGGRRKESSRAIMNANLHLNRPMHPSSTPRSSPSHARGASGTGNIITGHMPPHIQRSTSISRLVRTFAPEHTHILVVDDDAHSLEVVCAWLAAKKYNVTVCYDGEEAEEVLKASVGVDDEFAKEVSAGGGGGGSGSRGDSAAEGEKKSTYLDVTPAHSSGNEDSDLSSEPARTRGATLPSPSYSLSPPRHSSGLLLSSPHSVYSVTPGLTPNGHTPNPSSSSPLDHFDLILLDPSMETCSGSLLLDWVLAHPLLHTIPCILLSSDAASSSQSADRALRRGAEDFFMKSMLQRHTLLTSIRTILIQRVEVANSRRLKEWGDRYKRALVMEKTRDERKDRRTSLVGSFDYASEPPTSTPPSSAFPLSSLNSSPMLPPLPRMHSIAAATLSPHHSPSTGTGGGGGGNGGGNGGGVQPPPSSVRGPKQHHRNSSHALMQMMPRFSPGSSNSSVVTSPQTSAAVGSDESAMVSPSNALLAVGARSLRSGAATSPVHEYTTMAGTDTEHAVVTSATVLLVDPADTTRILLSQWLASINYHLIIQPSMTAALAYLRSTAAMAASATADASAAASATASPAKVALSPGGSSSLQLPVVSPSLSRGSSASRKAAMNTCDLIIADAEPFDTATTSSAERSAREREEEEEESRSRLQQLQREKEKERQMTVSNEEFMKIHVSQYDPPSDSTSPLLTLALTPTPTSPLTSPLASAPPSPPSPAPVTGSSFVSALRADPGLRHIPIVLLYRAHGPDANESTRSGVDSVLLKPVSKDVMLKKVNQLLTIVAQRTKSTMYAERAAAYRAILSSFRNQRSEEVRTGVRAVSQSPKTASMRINISSEGTTSIVKHSLLPASINIAAITSTPMTDVDTPVMTPVPPMIIPADVLSLISPIATSSPLSISAEVDNLIMLLPLSPIAVASPSIVVTPPIAVISSPPLVSRRSFVIVRPTQSSIDSINMASPMPIPSPPPLPMLSPPIMITITPQPPSAAPLPAVTQSPPTSYASITSTPAPIIVITAAPLPHSPSVSVLSKVSVNRPPELMLPRDRSSAVFGSGSAGSSGVGGSGATNSRANSTVDDELDHTLLYVLTSPLLTPSPPTNQPPHPSPLLRFRTQPSTPSLTSNTYDTPSSAQSYAASSASAGELSHISITIPTSTPLQSPLPSSSPYSSSSPFPPLTTIFSSIANVGSGHTPSNASSTLKVAGGGSATRLSPSSLTTLPIIITPPSSTTAIVSSSFSTLSSSSVPSATSCSLPSESRRMTAPKLSIVVQPNPSSSSSSSYQSGYQHYIPVAPSSVRTSSSRRLSMTTADIHTPHPPPTSHSMMDLSSELIFPVGPMTPAVSASSSSSHDSPRSEGQAGGERGGGSGGAMHNGMLSGGRSRNASGSKTTPVNHTTTIVTRRGSVGGDRSASATAALLMSHTPTSPPVRQTTN